MYFISFALQTQQNAIAWKSSLNLKKMWWRFLSPYCVHSNSHLGQLKDAIVQVATLYCNRRRMHLHFCQQITSLRGGKKASCSRLFAELWPTPSQIMHFIFVLFDNHSLIYSIVVFMFVILFHSANIQPINSTFLLFGFQSSSVRLILKCDYCSIFAIMPFFFSSFFYAVHLMSK